MATLAAQKVIPAGLKLTSATPAADSDKFLLTGSEKLFIDNGNASACTVTIDSPGKCSFDVTSNDHDLTVTIPAGESRFIGPFAAARYADADGYVTVSCSVQSDVAISVII